MPKKAGISLKAEQLPMKPKYTTPYRELSLDRSVVNATWSLGVRERSNSKTLKNDLNLFKEKNIECLFSGLEGRSCVESLPVIFVLSCILPLQMQNCAKKKRVQCL